MSPKLAIGRFYGTQSQSRTVADIRLTESLYSPAFRIPTHSHESAYFGLVLEGSYTETYEAKTRQCLPSTLLFHPAGEVHSECHDDVTVRILNIEFPGKWRERLNDYSTFLNTPLAKFILAVQHSYARESGSILSQPMAVQMLTDPSVKSIPREEGPYGLGVALRSEGDTLQFVHGGRNWGFDS